MVTKTRCVHQYGRSSRRVFATARGVPRPDISLQSTGLAAAPPDSGSTWSLSERDATITVSLHGDFDETQAKGLEAAVRGRMSGAVPGAHVFIFDLDGLRRCSVEGREVLASLQRHLGGVARRTAYVTSRPLFRGVALWICHSAPDSNARTFPGLAAATAWLTSSEARGEVLMRGAESWIERTRSLAFAKEARR